MNIKQAEEEVRELQKKMQQLENDLDQTQEKLMNANQRLEEKEKALQNVSHQDILTMITNCHFFLFSYFESHRNSWAISGKERFSVFS